MIKLYRKFTSPAFIIRQATEFRYRRLLETQIVTLLDNAAQFSQLKQVHARILRTNLDQTCYVITKLIRCLSNFDVPVHSYSSILFRHVHRPNPFLYTALIRSYTVQGLINESLSLYNAMRRDGVGPISFTFTALFKACGSISVVKLGRMLHGNAVVIGGFVSDLYVGNTLIDMYVKCGSLNCARMVFDEMPERDVISWTSLIVSYTKLGDMGSAGPLFEDFPDKDMVAWTAMVTGYVQNGMPREALECFERMEKEGVGMDEVTLVGVISACAQLGVAKKSDWICDVAEKSGFGHKENVIVGSAMIDMYSKCGNVERAYAVFKGMNERNVYSYSSMIAGFAMHGQGVAAIQLFHEMLNSEIKPNWVTLIGVLTACSHAKMVGEGRRLFSEMKERYDVEPSADHYACMVDMLGRAGHLQEALELIKTMPMEPHSGVWGALLNACRLYTNPDIAEVAAGHLFVLEPDGIGNYILLSNLYASAGRWDDVSRIRKLMKEKGMKKNPACSWVEAKKGVIHEFFAGDMRHPRTREIKLKLDELLDRLKLQGYVPNLSAVPYDVSDDEKKRILSTHSEKLALAFGLLSIDAGCPIRIVKNLRICEDCHSFMSQASQITGREIIVRDNYRFHHFHNGICSCGNFW